MQGISYLIPYGTFHVISYPEIKSLIIQEFSFQRLDLLTKSTCENSTHKFLSYSEVYFDHWIEVREEIGASRKPIFVVVGMKL